VTVLEAIFKGMLIDGTFEKNVTLEGWCGPDI